MSDAYDIWRLESLRETAANAQGQIDRQLQNLRDNQRSEGQENAGYLAVRGTTELEQP